MRIIALSTLKAFWEENTEYMDAKESTLAWYRHALAADWTAPADVKQDFRNASILKCQRRFKFDPLFHIFAEVKLTHP